LQILFGNIALSLALTAATASAKHRCKGNIILLLQLGNNFKSYTFSS